MKPYRRLCFLLIALLALAVVPAFAGVPQSNPDDYVDTFGRDTINLITQRGGTFVPFGQVLLALSASWSLLSLVRKQIPRGLRHHHFYIDIEEFTWWFVMLFSSTVILYYWARPTPGSDVTLCEWIPILFKNMAAQIETSIVQEFFNTLKKAFHFTPLPGWTDVVFALVFLVIMICIFSMSGIVFLIESFSYFAIGVVAICGPLVVWSLMTKTQGKRFWTLLDNMIVFSAYRLVANICLYLYCHAILDFFRNSFHGDYSLGHWLYLLMPTMMYAIGMIWAVANVPLVTRSICGGTSVGAMAESFMASAKNTAGQAVRFAMAA